MPYTEIRGSGKNTYYIARYKDSQDGWPAVKDEHGRVLHFKVRRDALKAGQDEEAKVRAGNDPAVKRKMGTKTFGVWANEWFAQDLDIALSTRQNYRHHLEEHLLPAFKDVALKDIDVAAWEAAERAACYERSSIRTWRTTLHTILEDAVDAGEVEVNRAARRRRRRGRQTGHRQGRSGQKVITTPLGVLLVAERAAILAGRDDEFVAVILLYFTGLRWAEMVGLEVQYVLANSIRVEWQLWEDDDGLFHVLPPKDDSRRDIAVPAWLTRLLKEHLARVRPGRCDCHDRIYVFHAGGGPTTQPTIRDVALHVGVSVSTVSLTLNQPDRVAEPTRVRVETAIEELGFTRKLGSAKAGVHWRRSGFGDSIFAPAVSGRYPKEGEGKPRRFVPMTVSPWPGVPVRGRGNRARAETCWMPVAEGLTPHGLRHSHKAQMSECHTPMVLSYERMGHLMQGIGGVYDHPTEAMSKELMDALTVAWESALSARRAMHPASPVRVLDELLRKS